MGAVSEPTAKDIQAALARRFCSPYYFYVPEIANAPGFDGFRRLDGVAVGLYKTVRYEILGFEIKVSRSDWLSEKKQPDKASVFMQSVDGFYLVCPRYVAGIHDLPKGWGLIEYRGERLYTIKSYDSADDIGKKPMDRELALSLLSRALIGGEVKSQFIRKHFDEGWKAHEDHVKWVAQCKRDQRKERSGEAAHNS